MSHFYYWKPKLTFNIKNIDNHLPFVNFWITKISSNKNQLLFLNRIVSLYFADCKDRKGGGYGEQIVEKLHWKERRFLRRKIENGLCEQCSNKPISHTNHFLSSNKEIAVLFNVVVFNSSRHYRGAHSRCALEGQFVQRSFQQK